MNKINYLNILSNYYLLYDLNNKNIYQLSKIKKIILINKFSLLKYSITELHYIINDIYSLTKQYPIIKKLKKTKNIYILKIILYKKNSIKFLYNLLKYFIIYLIQLKYFKNLFINFSYNIFFNFNIRNYKFNTKFIMDIFIIFNTKYIYNLYIFIKNLITYFLI